MTGLEKIVTEIRQEAAAEADAILADATAKAEETIARAQAESNEKADVILAAAKAEAADIKQGSESSLVLQRRQRVLLKKQELIGETLEKALQRLIALPAKEYFDLMIAMAAKEAQAGDGKLLLNTSDFARMPADFPERLAKALPKGMQLMPAQTEEALGGGFVLAYGDIEINCTFRAVMYARHNEFEDIIQNVLFA